MIDKLTNILVAVLVLVVMLAVVVFLFYVFIIKDKLKKKEASDDEKDFSKYDKRDVSSYMDFDDIFSDMIIRNNYTEFIGVVRVQANDDFANLRAVDRVNVKDSYVNFVTSINDNISYRQSSQRINFEEVRARYVEAHNKVEEELYFVSDELNKAIEANNVYSEIGNPNSQTYNPDEYDANEHEIIAKKVIELDRKVTSLVWRRDHLKEEISYIDALSKLSEPDRIETYEFSWRFNAFDYDYTLSKAEIVKKAIEGLREKENSIFRTLEKAGVSVTRLKTRDLIGLVRQTFCPNRANIFTLGDLDKSNLYDTVTSTRSLDDMDAALEEELSLLEYTNFEHETEEVDEDFVVYDIPELAYEGTAVELGSVNTFEKKENVEEDKKDEPTQNVEQNNNESEQANEEDDDDEILIVSPIESASNIEKVNVTKQNVSDASEDTPDLMGELEKILGK